MPFVDGKQLATLVASEFWIKNRFEVKDFMLDHKAYCGDYPDYDQFLADFSLDTEESKISMYEAVEEILSKFGVQTVHLHHSLSSYYDSLILEIEQEIKEAV